MQSKPSFRHSASNPHRLRITYRNLILITLLLCCKIYAGLGQPSQIKRTWHWYFGKHAVIDFSSGTAVADTNGALITNEGCATISDTAGNLLFYTDGRKVWNRLHQVMPNGTGIMGGAWGSSMQQALIIPKPLSPNLYYLFTTDEAENNGANGMRYTVIDMNLDGGFGDVDVSQKNILLFAPCTERLAATNHCNDTNVWVMGHEVNNNHFRAYLVTSNGIDTNAVVSAVGFPIMNNVHMAMIGTLKFSPDGRMLCTASDTGLKRVELFQFNNYSGNVSNKITLATNHSGSTGLSFSNDNTKLYIGGTTQLFQYDVSLFDSVSIVNSKTLLSTLPNLGFRDFQNTPYGSLFVLPYGFTYGANDSMIYCVQYPNNAGQNSQLINLNLSIPSHFTGGRCLPNFNSSYFRTTNSTGCNTGIPTVHAANPMQIFPNLSRDWIEVRGDGIRYIRILDFTGRMVYQSGGTYVPSSNKIDVSKFPRGIYFISVLADNKTTNKKIILQ
jgi:hypothetical protein